MSRESRHRASLLLNVILIATVVVLALHASEPAPLAPIKVTNSPSVSIPPPERPQFPDQASSTDQRRWLVDQLRAMGVPNDTLARMVMKALDKEWNKHGAEIAIKNHGDHDVMAAFQLQVDLSKDAEMRAALGDAGFKEWDQKNMLREINPGNVQLSSSESDAAYDLWKKRQQAELALEAARVNVTMDDADINDAQEKATSEFNQQMKTLLGDDRYAAAQQTGGGAAATLQQEVASANPSDSQFQQLLQTQQQWNDQRAALDKQYQNDPNSPAYASQLKALDDARDHEYQQVLGTNAFATVQKQQDPGYNQMEKFQTLWGLNTGQIDTVYAAMQFYQKTVNDYQNQSLTLQAQGQPVDWDTVNKNLQQDANLTQQALQNYLGQDTFNKMQRNGVFQSGPTTLLQHTKPSE
jgi:hypothetical protein